MANHKSALKRIRQNKKIRLNNSNIRAAVRTAIKKTRSAIDAKNKEEATTCFKAAEIAIKKAASSGLYHKNNAARKVSRLAVQVNGL